jgi:branched-chain amino acid aminotransferase
MPTRVNINGTISASEEARVSVFDHGFLYGDSIYESFRTYRKRPILFERNFARLEKAACGISLQVPWSAEKLRTEVYRTIDAANNVGESLVRIIVTRGEGDLTPDPDSCDRPNILIIALPLHAPADNLYRDGISIIISGLKRDTHIASIKTGNLIHQVLGAQEASAKNAVEAIFLTPDGYVSDGTRSNIYFVKDDDVLTPASEVGIVAGITRSLVLEVAGEIGIRIREEKFVPTEVQDADEAFITSTTRGILPVTRVDGRQVGDGTVGQVTQRLMNAFRQRVDALAGEGRGG